MSSSFHKETSSSPPPNSAKEWDRLSRRSFLQYLALWSLAGLGLGACTTEPRPSPPPSGSGLACRQPQREEEKTIAALAETVVPGKATDPQGHPGAIECCALELTYDEFFPTAPFLPLIVNLLDVQAQGEHQKKFVDLTPAQREEVAEKTEKQLPIITLAYRFFRAAFYNGEYNNIGREWMGYPGPNTGYIHHRDFTEGKAVCKELTSNGNMP